MSAAIRLTVHLASFVLLNPVHAAILSDAPPRQTGETSSSASGTLEVTGRVVNSRTHAPIPRALVQFSSRRVLTDRDGVFRFPQVSERSGSLTATKPGFFSSVAGESAAHTVEFASGVSIELPLYPEAILSGTVADAGGEGLPRMNVIARSSVFDETGHHWVPSGRTQTDSTGSFRLSLPAGEYALTVRSLGRTLPGSQSALPLSFPESISSNSSAEQAVHLHPGDQVDLQLRPEMRRTYSVTLNTDNAAGRRGLASFTARTRGGASIPLNPAPAPGGAPGELRVALPSGTYTLAAVSQNGDGREQAEASVTVPDRDVSGVPLHFVRSPTLPVVVEVDPGATSDNAMPVPSPQQLGLALVPIDSSPETAEQSFSLTFSRDRAPLFSVPAGAYRLFARSTGAWAITAATAGGTDLLAQNLVVASGMAATELRIRVSNATGTLLGNTELGGYPGPAWIYLVATTPTATPLTILRSNAEGGFSRPYLAPGSYRAIALEHRIAADFGNAETLGRFPDRVQDFTLGAGDQHTLTLDVVPAGDLAP